MKMLTETGGDAGEQDAADESRGFLLLVQTFPDGERQNSG